MPVSGERRCGPLAAGATPTFAVFSQDGADLLLVAGPATAAGVYVFRRLGRDRTSARPTGVQDFAAGATPPGWDLSSAVWGADGNSVLLVPITTEASGPVLQFDLTSGTATERLRLDAAAGEQFAEPVDDSHRARRRRQFRGSAERLVVVRLRHRVRKPDSRRARSRRHHRAQQRGSAGPLCADLPAPRRRCPRHSHRRHRGPIEERPGPAGRAVLRGVGLLAGRRPPGGDD